MAYRDTDFMYASARVSAFETKLFTKEKYLQLIDAASEKDAADMLTEAYTPVYADGALDMEATLERRIGEVFDEIAKSIPDPDLFDFMRYAYDANNLKAALKAKIAGVDPADMLYTCGTLTPAVAVEAIESGDYTAFPPHMATAAPQAAAAYAATRDPRQIDLLVDRAAFADMLACAAADPLLTAAVKLRIDTINVQTAVRMLDAARPNEIKSLLLEGGDLPPTVFLAADRQALAAALRAAHADAAVLLADADASLAAIGRAADALLFERATVQFVPFGIAKLYAYLSAVLTEVKNLRVIFALRAAHADRETILQNILA